MKNTFCMAWRSDPLPGERVEARSHLNVEDKVFVRGALFGAQLIQIRYLSRLHGEAERNSVSACGAGTGSAAHMSAASAEPSEWQISDTRPPRLTKSGLRWHQRRYVRFSSALTASIIVSRCRER